MSPAPSPLQLPWGDPTGKDSPPPHTSPHSRSSHAPPSFLPPGAWLGRLAPPWGLAPPAGRSSAPRVGRGRRQRDHLCPHPRETLANVHAKGLRPPPWRGPRLRSRLSCPPLLQAQPVGRLHPPCPEHHSPLSGPRAGPHWEGSARLWLPMGKQRWGGALCPGRRGRRLGGRRAAALAEPGALLAHGACQLLYLWKNKEVFA